MTITPDYLSGWTVLIHARTIGATDGGKKRVEYPTRPPQNILSGQNTVGMASLSGNTEDDNLVRATSSAEADELHPWPYLQTVFVFLGKNEKSC